MHHQRSSSPIPSPQDWACGPSACTYVLIFLRCDKCVFVLYFLLILFVYLYISKLIKVVLSTFYTLRNTFTTFNIQIESELFFVNKNYYYYLCIDFIY